MTETEETYLGQVWGSYPEGTEPRWLDYARGRQHESKRWFEQREPGTARVVDWITREVIWPVPADVADRRGHLLTKVADLFTPDDFSPAGENRPIIDPNGGTDGDVVMIYASPEWYQTLKELLAEIRAEVKP